MSSRCSSRTSSETPSPIPNTLAERPLRLWTSSTLLRDRDVLFTDSEVKLFFEFTNKIDKNEKKYHWCFQTPPLLCFELERIVVVYCLIIFLTLFLFLYLFIKKGFFDRSVTHNIIFLYFYHYHKSTHTHKQLINNAHITKNFFYSRATKLSSTFFFQNTFQFQGFFSLSNSQNRNFK